MIRRSLAIVTWAACCVTLAVQGLPAQETSEPSIQYLPLDAPASMSQAVVVQGLPLVHTRQLLPLDADGKLVDEGSADEQIEQVLNNLEDALLIGGSRLDKLVRLNVCALSHPTADRVRELLRKRTNDAVRPAITTVLTPLPHRGALVAVDAVAVGADKGEAVTLEQCEAVAGDDQCADAAVLPPGGVVYLSGQPERGGLAASAVAQSLSTLLERLEQLNLSPAEVVRLKVFLTPATSADAALSEIKRLFPGQLTPPVVFVEWIASAPVEIELIARLPIEGRPAETVEHYNPPEVKPSPAFSRAALVRTTQQIYISALSSRVPGDGEAQARDMFDQLKSILAATGSDMRHLAKATYYVSDDDGSRGIDLLRREVFDPQRPPAASKVTVHAVGRPERTLTIDMIAVGSAVD